MVDPERTTVDWRPSASIDTLRLRAGLLQRARAHFAATEALEVETPILVRAAVSDVHLEALTVRDSENGTCGYLHTSPEYGMKRLLCAGAPDIYQITHVFREGERGRRHNPEFTMIEWYRLGIDHHALMSDVEQLLRTLLEPHRAVGQTQKITYADAFEAALAINPLTCSIADLRESIVRAGGSIPASIAADARDELLDLAMSTLVAERFPSDRITFLHDFPASQAALARVHGPVAARFEAFWGSLELANGFHELDDAMEQQARFESDLRTRAALGRARRDMDRRFLAALAHGLPACAGVALGFDRVVMLAADAQDIDAVTAFPFERA
jgi:lysyl-tRNA synthetase class 2